MTRSIILMSAAIIGIGMQVAEAAPSGSLYIDDANGNIGVVSLSTGAVSVIGNAGVTLTDIAFTSSGSLYGTSFTSLYSISTANGASSLIGDYGAAGGGGMNALVGSGAGLYAASFSTASLYSIGLSPFTVTALTGSTGGGSAGDLAGFSANVLYETLADGSLVRLDVSSGNVTSTIVGNTGQSNVYGLARADDGTVYAVAGTTVYTVDLATAALTPFIDYSGNGLGAANGTAFLAEATPVPEPMSLALLGVGLLGAGLARRRQA